MLRCADSRDAPDGCCSIRTTPVVTPTINLSRRCCSAERIVDFLNTETLAGFAHVIATGDADLSEFSQVNHSEFSRSVAPTKVYVWHMILSSFSGAGGKKVKNVQAKNVQAPDGRHQHGV